MEVPRHADAIALGEADETWPRIVEDAARGELKEIYAPVDAFGQDRKPSLENYPSIPWERLDIGQFNRIPSVIRAGHASHELELGDVSHHSHRIRARLPLRLRILYGDRLLRRFHPLSL